MDSNKNNKNHEVDNIKEVDDEEDEHPHNEKLRCRLYRKDFPEEGDLVIVSL